MIGAGSLGRYSTKNRRLTPRSAGVPRLSQYRTLSEENDPSNSIPAAFKFATDLLHMIIVSRPMRSIMGSSNLHDRIALRNEIA